MKTLQKKILKLSIGSELWLEYPCEKIRRVPGGYIHVMYSPINIFSSPPPVNTFIPIKEK